MREMRKNTKNIRSGGGEKIQGFSWERGEEHLVINKTRVSLRPFKTKQQFMGIRGSKNQTGPPQQK